MKGKKKSSPVLAVRYFYADPYSGKEIKGKPSTTVYSPYAQARRAVAALNKGHRQYLGGLFVKGVILVCLLAGCAAPNAGTATSPVTLNLSGAHFCGSPTVTLTVTITPTSEASQKADAKADIKADATIPLK